MRSMPVFAEADAVASTDQRVHRWSEIEKRTQDRDTENTTKIRKTTHHDPTCPKPTVLSQCESLCDRSGYEHDEETRCPAIERQCSKRKRFNHFALCKSVVHELNVHKDFSDNVPWHDSYHNDFNDSYSSDDKFVIDSILGTANDDQALCVLKIEVDRKLKSVRFKVDDGSQVNILPKRIYNTLRLSVKVRIVPSSKIELYAYTVIPLCAAKRP